MKFKIVCLRPKKDFTDNGVNSPSNFKIDYFDKYNEISAKAIQNADVLVLPAVGDYIDTKIFETSSIKLIQVTGAGYDRVDEKKLRDLNISVCNVTGVNSNSVAEYCLGNAITLLRSMKKSDKLINLGRYSEVRKQVIQENLFGESFLILNFKYCSLNIEPFDSSDIAYLARGLLSGSLLLSKTFWSYLFPPDAPNNSLLYVDIGFVP